MGASPQRFESSTLRRFFKKMKVLTAKGRVRDLSFLILINIFAIVVSMTFKVNFLSSTVLFLGIPSIYLLYKEKAYLKKILLASVTFGLFFGFIFDLIAELNKAWDWSGGLSFGKILGIVQIDVIVWFFLWMLQMFLFYEHFIDRKKMKSNFSSRGLGLLTIGVLSTILVTLIYNFSPSLLHFDKAYLVLCSLVSVPFLIIFYNKPKLVLHTVPMIFYFFFVYLTHEITALHLDLWRFPGDYVGLVSMLGVSFPIEELIFWMILSSLIGSIYYEWNFDNQKN